VTNVNPIGELAPNCAIAGGFQIAPKRTFVGGTADRLDRAHSRHQYRVPLALKPPFGTNDLANGFCWIDAAQARPWLGTIKK